MVSVKEHTGLYEGGYKRPLGFEQENQFIL